MKIMFLKLLISGIILLVSVVGVSAQVKLGYDHYSQDYIHEHKIKRITEIYYEPTDFPVELGDMSHFINRRIEFDSTGKVIQDIYPNEDEEEGSVIGYAAYEKEETVEIKDTNDRVIERKFFYNEKYRYSKLFEHDSLGNVVRVLNNSNDSIEMELELFYDERGNNIKTIVHSIPSMQKIVRTFNSRNQLLTEKIYAQENHIKRLDSSVYDSSGNIAARYYFDYNDGTQILSDRFEFKYDSLNRDVWRGRYNVKSGEVKFHWEFQYNEQGNKSGRIDYSEGKVSAQFIWKYDYFKSSD